MTEPVKKSRQCPLHRMWMRKDKDGIKTCEICLLEREQQKKEYEKTGGSNKPPVVIKNI